MSSRREGKVLLGGECESCMAWYCMIRHDMDGL
jgi:hypothetical protein